MKLPPSPQLMSTEEIVRYVWLHGAANLPEIWVEELLRRLEALLDDGR